MSHPPALPHGPLREVFPDVFFVTGTSRPTFGGRSWQFSRNMVVVREAGRLTLVNTVRLDDDGLVALDRLGRVTDVIRLGSFHGLDDGFYADRYAARHWSMPGMPESSLPASDLLEPGGELPLQGASLFRFETTTLPEGLLLIERDGGILVSCDSLQNWTEADAYFDAESAALMASLGFIRPANIGPGFRQGMSPEPRDFERILRLAFSHLLPAHGTPLRDAARSAFAETFARELGVQVA